MTAAATFTGLELWSDVECAGGARIGSFEMAELVACNSREALVGDEWFSFGIYRSAYFASSVTQGRVIRSLTADASTYTEWRIADLDDESGGPFVLVVRCNSILADLSRSRYTQVDGDGNPYHDFTIGPISTENLIDDAVTDANAAIGIDWISRGDVDDTTEFTIDGEYQSARGLLELARAKVPSELRLRRNGSTDYKIDLLDEVGASAAIVYVHTGKNLGPLQRSRQGSLIVTRAGIKSADDSSHRGVGYARWLITVVNTAGQDYIRVTDPRGAPYPGPVRFTNQFVNTDVTYYAVEQGVAFGGQAITACSVVDANTSELQMTNASGYTAGRYLEIFTTNTAPGTRLSELVNPAAETAYGGVYLKDQDRGELSGSTNWVPNPRFDTWSNHSNPPDDYTTTGAGTFTYETTTVLWDDYPTWKWVTGGGAGNMRTATIRLYDDSPYAYRFWVWIYVAGGSSDAYVNVDLVRADTHASLTGAATYIPAADFDKWLAIPIESTSVGSAGGGCKVQVNVGGGGAATLYVAGFGAQPLAWNRTDTYTPKANDCHHAANDFLEQYQAPTSYRLTMADLFALHGERFADDELTLGGTLSIYDTELQVTTEQRLIAIERDYLNPLNTKIETGVPPRTLADVIRERALREDQIINKTIAAAGAALIAAGAAVTGNTSAADELSDAPSTGADVLLNAGKQLTDYATPKLARRFAGLVTID